MTAVYWLCLALAITVPLLIRAEFRENTNQRYIFKPISTSLLVVIILLSIFLSPGNQAFKAYILVGMLFCFGGDMALMFESRKAFLAGLISFLIGHVVYAAAMVSFNGFWFNTPATTLIVIIIGLPIFVYLYPGLGRMKIPVIAYMLVISFMLHSALLTFKSDYFNITQAWLLVVGAALFYLSDVILAINRFRRPCRYNRISLLFYYAGQLGIALSTVHFMNGTGST